MMPICYRCKHSVIGDTLTDIKCGLDPERNLFEVPFVCSAYKVTDDGQINYKKEVQ